MQTTNIFAMMDGVVEKVGNNYVVIKNNFAIMTLRHMTRVDVKVGQQLNRGNRVGVIGGRESALDIRVERNDEKK